ncbi:MAG: hypothetical protein IJV96_03375 [Clostridia bacterium]|nr:hypothetical protein [Clostridia bacterium]
MSEAEKKRRLDYKEKRKRGILIQTLVLLSLCILTIASYIVHGVLDKTYYVGYNERGGVCYTVQMKPNDYYEKEWLSSGQAYVAELTDDIRADFYYDLSILEGERATFTYTYTITSQLVVADKTNRMPIYNPTTVLKDNVTKTVSGDGARVAESVLFDFDTYRAEAEGFITKYSLGNAEGYALLTMKLSVEGNGEGVAPGNYETQFKIPLTQKTFTPEVLNPSLSVSELILACASVYNADLFFIFFIIFLSLAAISVIVLVLYIYATRNHDINYNIKLKKIISSYKCYIQRIAEPFDTASFQVVALKSFTEMLDIRDTLGAPLLMYENEDRTATSFLVPSTTGLLYSFELRVEDYDAIYGTGDGTYVFEKNKVMLTLEAIAHFFVVIGKALGWFFKTVGLAIAWFFKTVSIAIARFFKRVALAVARFFKRVALAIARFFKRLFTKKPKASEEAPAEETPAEERVEETPAEENAEETVAEENAEEAVAEENAEEAVAEENAQESVKEGAEEVPADGE